MQVLFTSGKSGRRQAVYTPVNVYYMRRSSSSSSDEPQSASEEEELVFDSLDLNDQPEENEKPLMMARPKARIRSIPTVPYKSKIEKFIWNSIYILLFAAFLGSIACFIIYYISTYSRPIKKGCSKITVEDIWVKGIPKITTESALRMVEANGDDILDAIIGFGTGAEAFFIDPVVCDIYFNGNKPCGGGVLILDGKSGEELWRVYTEHEIFALNCQEDLDGDNWKDCICGGRGATLLALSPKRRKIIWRYNDTASLLWQSNFYTAQFVPDLNSDGTPDVLEVHGGDPFGEPGRKTRVVGRLILLDGKTGKVLKWVNVPDDKESYYSPVLFKFQNEWTVLFGTGGETHGGSLWRITLKDLYRGRIEKAQKIYTDPYKGLMTPPIITDITKDGVKDLIFSAFNSSVLAYDGKDLETLLWNFTVKGTESYSTPSVGYFNNDSVPDFLVKFSVGPGFPLYYSAKTIILDGLNGKPLTKFFDSEIATQSSPLTWSFEGFGEDIFIFWKADCSRNGTYHSSEKFEFVKGTNVHEQSVRFNEEHSAWVNTTKEALDYLDKNKSKLPFFGDDMPHKRRRRHIGLHDAEGIQRYISSGTLAPRTKKDSLDNSIHLLFAVYWFYPAKTAVLFPKDKICIENAMDLEERRFNPSNKYYGMDRDGYERSITEECLRKSNRSAYLSSHDYDPYDLHMGQTTIYRIKLTCHCKDCKSRKFKNQVWPSYMGPHTDSDTFV